jgi:hypothetical protein
MNELQATKYFKLYGYKEKYNYFIEKIKQYYYDKYKCTN